MIRMYRSAVLIGALLSMPLLLTGCEIGVKDSSQYGPRGTAMGSVVNPSLVKAVAKPPEDAYPLETREGPRARDTYENVQVLGDISADEFNLLMLNITAWVAPTDQGCNYCHNPENMASDEVYQKVVARKMLQMTKTINTKWSSHVKQTGVTCYTCHRGQGVPAYYWTNSPQGPAGIRGNKLGQNAPSQTVAYASLPNQPFTNLLQGNPDSTDGAIRVNSTQIHPSADHQVSIKSAEQTYGLMMHMSSSLGVNCTFCHNSQNFAKWSREQRVGAWYGIRMVRDANDNYITPLKGVFPAHRLGPTGDPFKVNCQTCHQGVNKPLGGVSMLANSPSLREGYAVADSDQRALLAVAARTQTGVKAAAVSMPAETAATISQTASAVANKVQAATITKG